MFYISAGAFLDDQKHGQGVLKYYCREHGGAQLTYTGGFMFDKRWGHGRVTDMAGALIYDGQFKCDDMHGHGR